MGLRRMCDEDRPKTPAALNASALAFVALLCVWGCARHQDEGVVLRVSDWGGAGEDNDFDKLVQSFYKKFEADNPGVKLRMEHNPDQYVPKMMLNFVAGTEPDVMSVDASSAAVFQNNGVLDDLMPRIREDKDFHLDAYFPNVLEIGSKGDKLFTIPGDFTPMVMYYNKKLFDAAGVPYPKPTWTFEEFLRTAQALTHPDKKQYGFVMTNWMPGWVMWLWNNGGAVLSPDGKTASGYLDSPQNVRTVAFLGDLVKKYKVAPSLSQIAATGVDKFASGEAAMTVNGHWALVGYKNAPKDDNGNPLLDWRDLGVVQLPHQTSASNTVMYEVGFGITRRSKHKDLAWKFIKMWTSYWLQIRYNTSGIAVSARKDVARERAKEPIEKQFLSIVPTARPPTGSRVEGYDLVETIGQSAMDTILNNADVDVQAVLTKAAKRIDAEFAKR